MQAQLQNTVLQVSRSKVNFSLYNLWTTVAVQIWLYFIIFFIVLLSYFYFVCWNLNLLNKNLRFIITKASIYGLRIGAQTGFWPKNNKNYDGFTVSQAAPPVKNAGFTDFAKWWRSCLKNVVANLQPKKPWFHIIIVLIIIGLILYCQIKYNIIYADRDDPSPPGDGYILTKSDFPYVPAGPAPTPDAPGPILNPETVTHILYPSGTFKGSYKSVLNPEVKIIVYIDQIPTIIHGTFVNQSYNEWGPIYAYSAITRIVAGLISNLHLKKAWVNGTLSGPDTFDLDFLIKRVRLKNTADKKLNVFVDTAREFVLNLSETGNSRLLKLDQNTFNDLCRELPIKLTFEKRKTYVIAKILGHPILDPRGLNSSNLSSYWNFKTSNGFNRFTISPQLIHGDYLMPSGTYINNSLLYKAQAKFSESKVLNALAILAQIKTIEPNRIEKETEIAADIAYEKSIRFKTVKDMVILGNYSDYKKNVWNHAHQKAVIFRGEERVALSKARTAFKVSENASVEAVLAAIPGKEVELFSPNKNSVIGLDILSYLSGYSKKDINKFIELLIKIILHYLKANWWIISIFLFFILFIIILCKFLVFLKKINPDFIQKIEDKVKTLPYVRTSSKFILELCFACNPVLRSKYLYTDSTNSTLRSGAQTDSIALLINYLGNLPFKNLRWAVSFFFLLNDYLKIMD